MDSLGFYFHEHPLKKVNRQLYGIYQYCDLRDNPEVDYTFKRNGVQIPIYKTLRICGTVIAKDDVRSQISILTPESGVVTVKMTRDYFARLNKRISEPQPDGTKKVKENGWFSRGNKVLLNGFKRGNMFILKKYKRTNSHQCYKINKITEDGQLDMTWLRYGEEE